MIKKEPERAAAAADYKLEIHILATFKTLGGSQIILGRLSILLYLVWSVGLALYVVLLILLFETKLSSCFLGTFCSGVVELEEEEGLMQSNIET